LNGELKDVLVDLNTRLRKFKQAYAEELLARTERRTPVDTGALRAGWGVTMKQEGFEIYNTKEYAAYVEYGTPEQPPKAMLRTSLAEGEQIAEIAIRKVGLK
jgi:hypothetical protein